LTTIKTAHTHIHVHTHTHTHTHNTPRRYVALIVDS
jgi:hypothetical protein